MAIVTRKSLADLVVSDSSSTSEVGKMTSIATALAFVTVISPFHRVRKFALDVIASVDSSQTVRIASLVRLAVGSVINDDSRPILHPSEVNPGVLVGVEGVSDASNKSSWGDDVIKVTISVFVVS